ncbi:hypothetical protein [Pinisolibacter sp.]|uniref:hypothetical protein n=1 Tax=Pinisolibacter sp. TaxID=2172024 RepID=UPI002FDEF12B
MIAAKTALSATVILATLGLAGCQTTEERVYYSSASPVVSSTYVYDEGRYVHRRPPPVYVAPPPRHIRPLAHPPRYYGRPTPDPRGRFYNGPARDPRGRRFDGDRRWPQGTNGNAPGYDTQ